MRPFANGGTFDTFRKVEESIRIEIDGLDNDYVLNASQSELEELDTEDVRREDAWLGRGRDCGKQATQGQLRIFLRRGTK